MIGFCSHWPGVVDSVMVKISFDLYKVNNEYVVNSVDKSMREMYGLNLSDSDAIISGSVGSD